jgi:hypothetical protein
MTDQPPVQPPNRPANQPAQQPGQGSPPTEPMSAAASEAAPTPPVEPKRNLWRRATSTRRGIWAVGLGAGALAILMVLGIGFAGLAVLRNHDRVNLVGNRQDGFFRRDDGQGNGRGPGADDRFQRRVPARPGIPDGRGGGPGGLGGLLNGTALHGEVTASANGSVQALVFQLGEVTAVSATSITLKSSDGFTGTYGLAPATTLRGAPPVKGGQALVLARAADKVAIRVIATRAGVGAAPTPSR